jgi:succinate dehydrogenase / fumarate reductase, cytochrome b subunit
LPGFSQGILRYGLLTFNKSLLQMNNWLYRFLNSNWVTKFFFLSSIGKKIVMSLTGIFLLLFLVVHLIGNLQLLHEDNGVAFNEYAHLMGNNTLIQVISKGNFFFILLHAVIGTVLWIANRSARGAQGYAVVKTKATQTAPVVAKNMWFYGIVIFVFIIIHLAQFWAVMKYGKAGDVQMVDIDGVQVKDLYSLVAATFTNLGFVVFYVMCMVVIAFHLWHGFQSAFQSMGLNHPKYTPIIQFLGKAYSVLVPLGFAVIPIVFYLRNA